MTLKARNYFAVCVSLLLAGIVAAGYADEGCKDDYIRQISLPIAAPIPNPISAPDGAALYEIYCATCHANLANSSRKGASASVIQERMATPPFAMRPLNAAEVQAIADALQMTNKES